MAIVCPDLQTDTRLIELQAAVVNVVERQKDDFPDIPPDFFEDVWPYYLEALEHGGANRSWWLSYDELLAVATIARVPLIIFEEQENTDSGSRATR